MAITLSTAARNAACDAVVDLVDGGSGAGKLKLKAAGGTVLCTITLNDPAFDAASSGAAALDVSPAVSGTGSSAGTATLFDFTDSNDVVVFSGVVGIGSGELQLDNNVIAVSQVVSITAYTHTQPA